MTAGPEGRASVLRTGLGCFAVAFLVVLVVAGVLLSWGYFAFRDLDDTFEGSGADSPIPVGLLPAPTGTVTAVEAATGGNVWEHVFRHDSTFVGVADDVLVLQESQRLLAVDGKSGQERWRKGPRLVASCSPIVVDETVVGVTFGDAIVARDTRSGSERWRADLDLEQCGRLVSSDGLVIANYLSGSESRSGGVLAAFDALTGALRWEIESRGVLLDGTTSGMVFSSTLEGAVDAVDVRTGVVRWTWSLPTAQDDGLLLALARIRAVPAGVTVGFSAPDPDAPASSIRTITVFVGVLDGVERWRTKSGAASSFSYDVGTDTLVELGEPPVPVARDPATGKLRWTGTTRGSAVVTADGVVYVGDGAHEAFDAVTGAALWAIPPRRVNGTPFAVAQGLLLLGAE